MAALAKTEKSITALEKDAGRASAAVETKITALKSASDVSARRVDKVEGDSTARDAKTSALDKKVTALETKHKPLLADVSGLTTRITSVEGAVSSIKSETAAAKTASATAATATAQRLSKVEGDAASHGTVGT
jgi:hypothetical protein